MEICFDTMEDAEEARERLVNAYKEHGFVSMVNLYTLIGIIANHTSEDYERGWAENINSAYVRQIHGPIIHYTLVLPEPTDISDTKRHDDSWICGELPAPINITINIANMVDRADIIVAIIAAMRNIDVASDRPINILIYKSKEESDE